MAYERELVVVRWQDWRAEARCSPSGALRDVTAEVAREFAAVLGHPRQRLLASLC